MRNNNRSRAVLALTAAAALAQSQTAAVSTDRLTHRGGNVLVEARFPQGMEPADVWAVVTRHDGTEEKVGLTRGDADNEADANDRDWVQALRFPANTTPADRVQQVRVEYSLTDGQVRVAGERSVVVMGRGVTANGNGLRATYFSDDRFRSMTTFRSEPTVDLAGHPFGSSGGYGVVWEGWLTPEFSEEYTLQVASMGEYALTLDGQPVVSQRRSSPQAQRYGKVMLQAGRRYAFRLEHYSASHTGGVRLTWSSPSTPTSLVPMQNFTGAAGPRPSSSLRLAALDMEGEARASGQSLPFSASTSSKYPLADAWAEWSGPDGRVRYAAAMTSPGSGDVAGSVDFPANSGWQTMSYKVRMGVRDEAGFEAYTEYVTVRVPGSVAPPTPTPSPTGTTRPPTPVKPAPKPSTAMNGTVGRTFHSGQPVMGDYAEDLIAYGKRFLGVPYKWGGTNLEKGVDCSGYVQSLFKKYGVNLPRTAAQQSTVGFAVTQLEEMRPGDRLYFQAMGKAVGHTGLYIGGGKFMHSTRGGVQISDLGGYWKRTLVGVRR